METPIETLPETLPRWVLSDTHFGHLNMVRHGRRPADHEARMLAAWHASVGAEETLLHLGDVAYGPLAEVEALLSVLAALPGRVLLVRGNHDARAKLTLYERIGWHVIPPFALEYRGWQVTFSHKPPPSLPPRTLAVHGHLHAEPAPSPCHLNVSVERLGYRPENLAALLDARIAGLAGGPICYHV